MEKPMKWKEDYIDKSFLKTNNRGANRVKEER